MNDKEKKKLAKIPEPKPEKEEMKATLSLVTDEQVNKMQDSIVKLADSVSTYLEENKELLKSIDKGILDSIEENTDILAKTTDAIEAMAIANNKDQIAVQEKSIAEITKAMAKIDKLDLSKVTITNPTDTTELAKSKDFVKLEKAIVQVSQRVNDLTETLKPNQAPEEFIPYRRVVKRGNGFVFDDNDYSRGGGGGSSSSSSGQTQIVDGSGNAVTVTGNKLDVNATVTSSGGAILDGVDNTIKSTVFDYVSSNPVAVRLTDTNGDYIAAGAGTQYTEDVASVADPIGTQLIARRRDTLASETTTDGDNTAVNSTAKGELYVKHTDAIPVTDNSGSLTVDNAGTFAVQADTELPAAAALADATASPTAPAVGSFGLVRDRNAGNWNLQTQVSTASTNTTGAGIAAAGIVGQFDDTTPGAVTENSFGNIRMSSRREVYNQIRDAAGNERGANVTASNALVVDGSAVTQPVSGSVTANAGTNLNTSLLALESGGNLASVATNTTNIPNVIGTAAAAIPSKLLQIGGSDGTNARAISTTTAGLVKTDLSASAANTTAGLISVKIDQTTDGTTNRVNANVAQIGGNTVNTGSGTAGTGTQRVILATDQTLTNNIIPGQSVSTQTALTTTATVSGSAGRFHGGSFINLNSAPAYIQVFDTTGAVTLGTTTPTFVQPVPANSTAANGIAYVFNITGGITMANGIKVAATTTATGASTVATALIGYITYK